VTDGQALDLVLRPGNGAARTTLAIERLASGRVYEVSGAAIEQIEAGPDGRAIVDIELDGRLEVSVRPQA
jgi:hypothetical protein